MTNKYYDACLFGNALNSAHACNEGCFRFVTVDSIDWNITCCPEIVLTEFPSIREFFEQFFVYCALSGIVYRHVTLAEAKSTSKIYRPHKRPLNRLGFRGNDWNHLMAAVSEQCDEIITTDEDFFDPSNKINPGAAKKGKKVSNYIKEYFNITIVMP
ncbi:hypothetical protein [Metallibacterium sp.]|uniref:hypothetical protein n=1 Tax=Metallibacterium sp. TaxID=2940281 RepID=UPI0026033E7E|nr:hypothetical protein [Metallibacterium sp.]